MKRIKNSKAGRNFIIAATAFVALAVPATANAAVTLDTDVNIYQDHASVTVNDSNGWTVDNCQNEGNVLDSSGNPVFYEFNISYGNELNWWPDRSYPTGTHQIAHAQFSCNMTKTVTKVTYEMRWRSFTKHRSGVNTTSRSHSGSCYINNLSPELHLDCWGGNYAQANYHFALPSDARNISRNISTRAGCCSYSGYTRKYWSGNTAIVRVTGWHGVYVRGVTISYQHRVKVRVVTKTYLHDVGYGQF